MADSSGPFTYDRPGASDALGASVGQPSPVYARGEDNLRIATFASIAATVTVSWRMLTPDGQMIANQQTFVTTNDRALHSIVVPLAEGWIVAAEVVATSGSPAFGQVFVALQLVRGLSGAVTRALTFAKGYVTANDAIVFPFGLYLDSLDGPGWLQVVTVANPAAGADWTTTVPTGARWQILSVSAQLVTAVAAANRLPRLILDDGATILFEAPALFNHAASITLQYSWGGGCGGPVTFDSLTGGAASSPLPNDLLLAAGHRVRSSTGAIQAADQWSAIRLLVREWLDT